MESPNEDMGILPAAAQIKWTWGKNHTTEKCMAPSPRFTVLKAGWAFLVRLAQYPEVVFSVCSGNASFPGSWNYNNYSHKLSQD